MKPSTFNQSFVFQDSDLSLNIEYTVYPAEPAVGINEEWINEITALDSRGVDYADSEIGDAIELACWENHQDLAEAA